MQTPISADLRQKQRIPSKQLSERDVFFSSQRLRESRFPPGKAKVIIYYYREFTSIIVLCLEEQRPERL